jgi:hypothetical protein
MKKISLRGSYSHLSTLVDDGDYAYLSKYKWWRLHGKSDKINYAVTVIKNSLGQRTFVLIHRLLVGLLNCKQKQIDHINHNGLDNRRINLRIVTAQQNAINRRGAQTNSKTGILGVSWSRDHGKWVAQIKTNGKSINLGYFSSMVDAIKARKRAVRAYFEESS